MKKRIIIVLTVIMLITMIPMTASAKTTAYYCGDVFYKSVAPSPYDFFTNKTNREKIGTYYFYTTYSEKDESVAVWCSKSKTGKAVKIAKAQDPLYFGEYVIAGNGKIFYTIMDTDKNKTKIYRIDADGKNKKLLKTLKGNNVLLERVYSNSLYYINQSEPYVDNLYKLDLSTLKTVTLYKDIDFFKAPSPSSVRYMYLTLRGESNVIVFDCKSNKKVGTISLPLEEYEEISQLIISDDLLYILTDREDFDADDYALTLYSAEKTGDGLKLIKKIDYKTMFGIKLTKDGVIYPTGELTYYKNENLGYAYNEKGYGPEYLKYCFKTDETVQFPSWELYIRNYG